MIQKTLGSGAKNSQKSESKNFRLGSKNIAGPRRSRRVESGVVEAGDLCRLLRVPWGVGPRAVGPPRCLGVVASAEGPPRDLGVEGP